ncbi:putative bifunctional diguanylate cyclase/phosphodiesterase [Rhizobium tumorigenes]|uniref:putative bifunctional diguanylate cyclase/phosphodiesterase n=1 Tax=Rhizobium tumorigenes TaxID=2041385 RepID=UPI00241C2C3B|nr:sensor domain-containing phosphodiesterase [Rhizobium tumorigenes]WFS04248.1 sensor domain-containing phosphodiesterase [Rhizobium tumorigenes]
MTNSAEQERLEALYNLGLLDTPASENFDRITRMASKIFNLPIAAVSLTDVDRQWFKSRVGVDHNSIPRDRAPCAQVAECKDLLVIPDMAEDSCYRESVLGKSGIRFYAGAPLITREGHGLGALCVLGTEPRTATEEELSGLRDLAAMVMSQIELQHSIGRIDPISGLPNRVQFFDDLSDLVLDDASGLQRFAVLVDLADSTQIDTLARVMGPAHVDTCIREAGRIIRSSLGNGKTTYHVSSTQFAFVAPKGVRKQKYLARLGAMLTQIEAGLSLRFMMTPVMGVAPFIARKISPAELLQELNSAAQDARGTETRVSLFSASSHAKHERAFRLLEDFGLALESNDQLSVVFQPRMDLASGRCVAAEVLLRWRHPDFGAVSPGEFVAIIEHSPHVRKMTAWVLDAALRQTRAWKDNGLNMPLSVNVSAANLEEEDFAEQVVLALLRHEIPVEMLELEVTESSIMKDAAKAMDKLRSLAEAGIRLSIDDFGTGYSSLSYLQLLPATVVKIDQSFIRTLEDGTRERNLVRSMISLSHDLGYRVVAEGVETREARDILAAIHCDEAQGYLFAKPLKPREFERWHDSQQKSLDAATGNARQPA